MGSGAQRHRQLPPGTLQVESSGDISTVLTLKECALLSAQAHCIKAAYQRTGVLLTIAIGGEVVEGCTMKGGSMEGF